MSEKINGLSPGQVGIPVKRTGEQLENRSSANASGKAVEQDTTTVNLTENAVLLGRLDQALAASADIDVAKIESVKEAIASGNYEIDADKIASALLRLDDELAR